MDLCTNGLKAHDAFGNGAGVRRVRIMSNMATIIKAMPRRCIGHHRHIGRDQPGAVVDQGLPEQMCRHLVKCIDVHIKDECASDNMALMQVAESDGAHDVTEDGWRMYVDDRTGGKLDSKLVAAARKKEIQNLEDMGVYVKVPKRVAVTEGAKILDVRWVDIEKADLGMPSNVKSRCVVKDFATTIRDDLFAGTPALEAVKLIISLAASSRRGLAPQKRIMVMDVKGAFLHAAMRRKVYINLPEEATRGDKEEMVGLLKRAMYGTRDAPQCWQEHVKGVMEELGVAAGKANPCVFRHRTRNLVISVHVDDFICAGPRADLDWVRKELAAHCQCTSSILGPDAGEQKQVKYLSRGSRMDG